MTKEELAELREQLAATETRVDLLRRQGYDVICWETGHIVWVDQSGMLRRETVHAGLPALPTAA